MLNLSIIVPIYNTGEYLHKCFKSILSQTLTNFELILVDDGSIDNSGEICDDYAAIDSRIKVIHKKNEGVSIARNTGISIAQGEYVGFIDSDDWIEPDMFEKLYSLAVSKKCDIVMCDAVTKYDDKTDEEDTITRLKNDTLLCKKDIYPELLCELAGSSCRCIYKNELLKGHDISFPQNIPLSEDRIFNILAMGYADSIYYTKTVFYNRYIRKGSAVNKYYNNMCSIIEKVHSGYMFALKKAWNDNVKFKHAYNLQIVNMTHAALNNAFYKNSPQNYKEKLNEIKNICRNEIILNAIKETKAKDLRSKLILNNNVVLLGAIAFFLKIKHRR